MKVIYRDHIKVQLDKAIVEAAKNNKIIDKFELTEKEYEELTATVIVPYRYRALPFKDTYAGIDVVSEVS